MFITKTVNIKGKEVSVKNLKPNSAKKVTVKCPECNQTRTVCYRSIAKAGHHVCQKCRTNQAKAKHLQPGAKYGMVTIISQSKSVGASVGQCECGAIRDFDNWNLVSGRTKSCGCLKALNFENAETLKGENHPNWKGGISSERARTSASREYKAWRVSVFERDHHKCVCCEETKEVQTHHLVPYRDNKALSMDISNGATVCPTCHRLFHKIYGRKNNTKEQFETFCNERRAI